MNGEGRALPPGPRLTAEGLAQCSTAPTCRECGAPLRSPTTLRRRMCRSCWRVGRRVGLLDPTRRQVGDGR